jgi:hypothetical protein
MKVNYTPEKVAALFHSCSEKWWIAGGWAIDLFLGQQTREHEDVDVAILRDDELAFRRHLSTWELWPGLGNDQLESNPLTLDQELPLNREVLWCRPTPTEDWAFELLLNKTIDDDWVFKRNDSVRIPISTLGEVTPDGIPYLKPEVVLLFKAKSNRDKDQIDFDNVISRLNTEALTWLRSALSTTHPNHSWLNKL